jgi:hypothetical protein
MELLALLKNKLGASYRQTTHCKVTKKKTELVMYWHGKVLEGFGF